MKSMFWATLVLAPVMAMSASQQTDKEKYLQEFMKSFQSNPRAAMAAIPPKFDQNGKRIQVQPLFDQRSIESGSFVKAKAKSRRQLTQNSGKSSILGLFAEIIDDKSDVSNFFPQDYQVIRNISNLQGNLLSATAPVQPWSSTYWPSYQGGIAARYADPSYYTTSEDFKDYYAKGQSFAQADLTDATVVDNLSPAEKYDIMVGDTSFGLTNYEFTTINNEYTQNGSVEDWEGICHGWTPASIFMNRPQVPVQVSVPNFNGNQLNLTFYPDDVKALADILWANANVPSAFMGTRCDDSGTTPLTDDLGRLVNPNCRDLNPGSWHMTMLNQLGNLQKSFIMDASYDYQVWNQPVASYSVRYYNPITTNYVDSLQDGLVAVSDFTADKFAKYRAPGTVSIVGVSMDISYVAETKPTHQTQDFAGNDRIVTVTYIYDLELDAQGNIIGGEWFQNAHPNFAWQPLDGQMASTPYDSQINPSDLAVGSAAPAAWTSSAVGASQGGQPLTAVVQSLIQQATPAAAPAQ